MNPIENKKFSEDFQNFVLQDGMKVIHIEHPPKKPFNLDPPKKSDKSKKNKDQKDPKDKENSN